MGSIVARQAKSGRRYSARVRCYAKGEEYTESKTFATKREAQAWIREREGEIEKTGVPVLLGKVNSSVTVAYGLDRYLQGT